MRILHINNQNKGTIYGQVILPFINALNKFDTKNEVFSPEILQNGTFVGKVGFHLYLFRVFLEKILRKILTRNDYYFYNIFNDRIRILLF